MRALDSRGGTGFLHEALHRVRLGRRLGREELDRDGSSSIRCHAQIATAIDPACSVIADPVLFVQHIAFAWKLGRHGVNPFETLVVVDSLGRRSTWRITWSACLLCNEPFAEPSSIAEVPAWHKFRRRAETFSVIPIFLHKSRGYAVEKIHDSAFAPRASQGGLGLDILGRASPARSMITKEDQTPPEPAGTAEPAPCSVAHFLRSDGGQCAPGGRGHCAPGR